MSWCPADKKSNKFSFSFTASLKLRKRPIWRVHDFSEQHLKKEFRKKVTDPCFCHPKIRAITNKFVLLFTSTVPLFYSLYQVSSFLCWLVVEPRCTYSVYLFWHFSSIQILNERTFECLAGSQNIWLAIKLHPVFTRYPINHWWGSALDMPPINCLQWP